MCRFILLLPLVLVACTDRSSPVSAARPDAPATAPTVKSLTPAEFSQLLRQHPDYRLLDVRTPEEFSAGHLPGAINLDVNAPDFDQKIAKLDKSKTHLIYCRSGRRSAAASEKLAALNIPTRHLAGGIVAWQSANLPTTRP